MPDANHDRGAALPGIAVGVDAVLAAKRDEDPNRSDIWQGILHLGLRIVIGLQLEGELRLETIACRPGRRPLARGRTPCEQRLELRQLLA
ncbi:hypothetical protein Q0601_22970 [Paracoccus onubensis]|uniref:hypothetical protein n=1 Tax=Paracoccus onubensis TaxID=1675788 RepID=UPI002731F264|nr:hypothetical protein [Paracoccus onubensis]MDP0930050.1 hypothetical protein [Paracoccus onubensis]